MSKEHKVLIAPGMDGRTDGIRWVTKNWLEKYGLSPEFIEMTWKDNVPLEPKLDKVIAAIDRWASEGDTVSLIGCSAGGSLMLNAFAQRKDKIHRVVNLSGFLRPGNSRWLRSFPVRSAKSIAFRESVLRFEEIEPTLSEVDRRKILTVSPLFDELVPADTVVVKGALNRTVPMIEHVLGIWLALALYDPLIVFLKQDIHLTPPE